MDYNHFKINVAIRDGFTFQGKPRFKHWFVATVRDRHDAENVYRDMVERYPVKDDQWAVTCTEFKCGGYAVDFAPAHNQAPRSI